MHKKYIYISLFFFIFVVLGITQFSGNSESSELSFTEIPKDFEYDGCSLFPDMDMLDCCTEHDREYFFGGTWQQRVKADNEFFSCVAEKGHWYSTPLATIMWTGVRVGGSPLNPSDYRWGFGRDMY